MSTRECRQTGGERPFGREDLIGQEHWVVNGDVTLHLWEKHQTGSAGKPVLVLAHGSATAGRESFDLQVPSKGSYSFMDYLAHEGYDVFAPDMRGFGRSTRPERHITTQDACDDLRAIVNYITGLRSVQRVHLLGWSWGTQYAGMFVVSQPAKVASYVSYAQMHEHSPDIVKRRSNFHVFRNTPYITISEEGWKARFYSMTPDSVNDPDVVETFAKAAAQVETKTPIGPQIDMVTLMPLVHARLIVVPTMIIHGEYDDVADIDGLFPFFKQLANPDRRYVVIPRAGHMMHLQEGHKRFHYEVSSFFKAHLH